MAYATRANLGTHGLPAAVLAEIATADQDAALEAVSDELDEALRAAGYGTPLATYSTSVVRRVCEAASYHLMVVRGYQPDDDPVDDHLRRRYEDFLAWKSQIAKGTIRIAEQVEDATPSVDEMQPLIDSDDDRGG